MNLLNHDVRVLPQKVIGKLRFYYGLYIARDAFSVAVNHRGDQTLRLDYPLNERSIVFDLGGYKGDFASSIFEKYGCTVYAFELSRIYYDACARRFQGNLQIRCLNFGLAAHDGNLYLSDEDNGSRATSEQSSDAERVSVRSASKFILEHQIKDIDLMKGNIEGAE